MWVQGRLTGTQATTRPGNIWPEEWSNMSDNYQRRATKKWAEEKNQIGCSESKDNFYFVANDDPGYEDITNNAERNGKWGRRCHAKSPHQPERTVQAGGGPVQVTGLRSERKTLNSSRSKQDRENIIIESQRKNYKEHRKTHKDHRGPRSSFHVAPQRGAQNDSHTDGNEHDWGKGGRSPNLPVKLRWYEEQKIEGKTVHVSTFMDLCHLKNSELENKFQKYKARAVLRGETVKNDSGKYVEFTEHGTSATQMTVAEVLDVLSRLPGCCGQGSNAVTANSQVKMKDAPELLQLSKEDCPIFFDEITKWVSCTDILTVIFWMHRHFLCTFVIRHLWADLSKL